MNRVKRASRHVVAAALSVAAAGCGSDTQADNQGSAGTRPAVLIGVYIDNLEVRSIYVGAVPEVPEGELDYSGFARYPNRL